MIKVNVVVNYNFEIKIFCVKIADYVALKVFNSQIYTQYCT